MYNDRSCIMLAHFWTFSDPPTQWNLFQNFTGNLMIILDSSISLHLIATDKLYNGIFKRSLIYLFKYRLLQQLWLLLRKGKQIIKNGYSYNSIKRICSIKHPGLEFFKNILLNVPYHR